MKTIIITIMMLAFATVSYAACGKKAASIGKVQKYDAETKELTVTVTQSSDAKELEAKTAKLTMTPDSKVLAEGDIASLVGKEVTVVSEHGKIDYVIALAKPSKEEDAS